MDVSYTSLPWTPTKCITGDLHGLRSTNRSNTASLHPNMLHMRSLTENSPSLQKTCLINIRLKHGFSEFYCLHKAD